ncbi:AdoMet-dependent rRNA methyltransferase SPB1 [Yarrowia sp. B02]|nr:AdoMet-dependent rRNA methyltransferase SPB1 [Yarrowia sp. B02]
MGKIQKKHGKGRLDHYYRLAKEKGYRARSSFKIIQINQKYGKFLEKSKVVIDLCAAPGSWCQVASQVCPVNSLIIGCDIVPIKPLPNVITFQSDITTDHCRQQLRQYMKTWKADTVMHDGAPNVGMAWAQDAFTQSELVLQSLKLAVEFLNKGGTFVTKVFRSKDYNNLMWVFQQFFEKVEATKPPSSRNVSAEIFVVCLKFKAPKKIDPRLLDAKYVFEEVSQGSNNNEAKVFNPEVKRRKREGYEEGEYLQHKRLSVLDFITDSTPIDNLGETNEMTWTERGIKEGEVDEQETVDERGNIPYVLDDKTYSDEDALKMVAKLPQSTPELLECLKDLKVLGRKEFRAILKWRLSARDLLQLDKPEAGVEVEEEELDEEELIDKELGELGEREKARKKRERRRRNEMKQREITRMQMNMTTPTELGIEAAKMESLFNLKQAERSGKLSELQKGKRSTVSETGDEHVTLEEAERVDYGSDDEANGLEDELENMYTEYLENKAARTAKSVVQRKKADVETEAWYGIEDKEEDEDGEMSADDVDMAAIEEEDEGKTAKTLGTSSMFFSNPIFDNLVNAAVAKTEAKPKALDLLEPGAKDLMELEKAKKRKFAKKSGLEVSDSEEEEEEEDVVEEEDSDSEIEYVHGEDSDGEPNIDLVTDQAMTMAHQLATGQTNKHKLQDDGYNRYSFRDLDGLPQWFQDDENKHNKLNKPITKEAVEALKQKMKALNARPIKKVLEAKGRKKMRALRRLEQMKKKSEIINEDGSRSEKEKADDISKLMRKLAKPQKSKKKTVTVVYAGGKNKGIAGRPRGVTGKYKMVDGTMKKEQRAIRRIKKARK